MTDTKLTDEEVERERAAFDSLGLGYTYTETWYGWLHRAAQAKADLAAQAAKVAELEQELETERLRLAACGVAAMSNTPKSVADRITADNPYYSASYGDVCRAVDREMAHRDRVEELERDATRWRYVREGRNCVVTRWGEFGRAVLIGEAADIRVDEALAQQPEAGDEG